MGKRKFTDEQEQEICQRYLAGESGSAIGAVFGVRAFTIYGILNRNGIGRRSNSESKGGLSVECEAEICRRYEDGRSTYQLGAEFDLHSGTVGRILRRNGIKPRSLSEAMGGILTELEPEVCRRYQSGKTTYQLGADFGVSAHCICSILRRNKAGDRPR